MYKLAPSSVPLPPSSGREEAEVLIKPGVVQDDGVSLRDYWRVIRRRLWLIVITCFGIVLATALVVSRMTPIYTAETTLLIERQAPQVLEIREVLPEPLGPDEYDFYKTQYEILKSRTLAAWSIREQGLEAHSLSSGEGRENGFVARLWAEAQGWAGQLFAPAPKPEGENPLGVKSALVDSYMSMLEIKPVPRTRLVKIAFNTPDPELSARLANIHAQAYIRQGLGLRTRANEEAQRFLEEKLAELKGRMEESETALNRYRRDRQIISLDDKENIVVERLADLNKRLTEAEADRIALEAQVHLIRKRDYDSLPAVINSGLIGAIKPQLARLEGEYAYLATQFRPGYPRLDQLKAQVEETRRRLSREVQKVVAGIESAYQTAAAKEKKLLATMEAQKAAALRLKDASVNYAILAREVDTNRQLYDSVLQRMKETGVAAELRTSNVSVIDQAEPPRTPSKPRKKKSLVVSALLGLMGGVGLALFFEHLDNTLKSPEEVERYLRLPNLGVVPDFFSLDWRKQALQRFLYTSVTVFPSPPQIPTFLASDKELTPVPSRPSFSMVAEAYRTLRTAILLSRAGEPPKTVLFTSGIHGEGKTVTVVNTAIIFAQMGVRVLVIDADLRRPDCHQVLGLEKGLGLTEVLTGQGALTEAIRPTGIHNCLFLLSAGSIPPNPAELVGSKKMQETVTALREQYDHILIDSPPVMQLSDAVLLSTMVDGVVLVVSNQETPKYVVTEACSRLNYARAKILGVILNRVNLRSGDYAYYYHPYYS